MLKITLASLHLLALGLGLGAVIVRGAALRESPSAATLGRVLRADTLWGVAAALWLATGLWRLFAGTEKPPAYYYGNGLSLAKLGLFALVCALEVRPMLTLIRWRAARRAGAPAEQVMAAATRRKIATI